MRRILSILVVLLLVPALALADLQFIDAGNADRVHLRADSSQQADSLGLYFTGTPLISLGIAENGYVPVLIGTQHGFIRQDLLTGKPDTFAWPKAEASTDTVLRTLPYSDADEIAAVSSGQIMAVLGETAGRWCFVRLDGVVGYVPSKHIAVAKEAYAMQEAHFPIRMPQNYFYSSGVGAWYSAMTILPDGSFVGYHTDTDMGDGVRYESCFFGTLEYAERIGGDFRYVVRSLQVLPGDRWEDELQVVTSQPAGIAQGDMLSMYLYDLPLDDLPPEYLRQMRMYEADPADHPGLYVHEQLAAWLMESAQ